MPDKKDKHEETESIFVTAAFQNMVEQMCDMILVFDVHGRVIYANHAASGVYGYSAAEFRGIRVHDLYSPEERNSIGNQMKATGQKAVLFQAVHLRRDGTSFPVEISFYCARFADQETFVSVVRELSGITEATALKISEKKYQLLHEKLLSTHEELTVSEEELRQQFDELLAKEEKIYRQNTVLNLLHDLVLELMADPDQDDILEKIIAGIMEIFGVPNSLVHFVNEEKETFTFKIGTGIFAKFEYEGKFTEGLFGQVYETGRIAVVDDYSVWEQRLLDPVFDEVHYFALVPLKNRDRMIGTIGLAFSEPGRTLDEYGLFLLQRFADLASLALSNANLVASLHNEIQEHKQTEAHLRQSEERFYKIYQMSPSAVCVVRQDGTYVNVNESFCKNTGYAKEEFIGKTREDLNIWVDERDKDFLLQGLKNHGKVDNLEEWFRCKDGREICGLMSARIVTINGEECALSITHNITKQRKTEAQLKLSEEKFSQAFYLSPDAIAIIRLDGTLLEMNQSFIQLHGYSKAEAIGGKTVDLGLWADYRDRERMLEVLKSQGEVRNLEVRFRHKGGNTVYGQLSARLLNLKGEPCYMVGVRDITEQVRAEKERRQQAEIIQHMAYFDSVTGLPNRRHLNEWLNKEIERACRGEASGAVLFIDLDNLKMVNDTYGHTCGDEIIIAAGTGIVASIDEEAFVARIGGDEFVVILPGKNDREQINEIVQRISKALGQKQENSETQFHMTASVGIAFYPADGNTAEEIIKNADNAMYAAKKDGKNCWRFYTVAMQNETYEKMRLTSGLLHALERGELSLVYQPQIFPAEGTVLGFEALLRWNSSEHGGTVAPMRFVPLAEQSGLIHSIGQWVLYEACRFVRRLTDQGWSGIHVAVNVSSKQLAAADFIAVVRSAVRTAGIQLHQLELEITESLLMTSLEDAASKLAKLKALGVRISLDDFGTGYSSLTYLRRLPVGTLKIDKSFIDMITTDAHGAKIIGSIINMAHILNMMVVAEGVETEQQLVYLANNGCDIIQGYLFSRPVPEAEAIEFLHMFRKIEVEW